MNPAAEPSESKPKSNAWIGLLVGFGLLALVVWANSAPFAPAGKVVELTGANWQKEVVESDVPVVVDFWASWCLYCKDYAPTIRSVANTYAGRVKFGKLNVEDAGDVAKKYDVNGLPYTMIFKQGKLAARPFGGAVSERELARVIDGVLKIQ